MVLIHIFMTLCLLKENFLKYEMLRLETKKSLCKISETPEKLTNIF